MLRTFLLFTFLTACLSAQTNNAVIRGSVGDPDGAKIVGAKVVATNQQTGVPYSAASNDAGLYLIPDVPVGQYNVSVEKPWLQEIRSREHGRYHRCHNLAGRHAGTR